MEFLGVVLQATTIVISAVSLVQSRRLRGRRLAERAETSLRLAAALVATDGKSTRATIGADDPTSELVGELTDDARVNTARYLQAGRGLGLRSSLLALGTVYCVMFITMGVIDLKSKSGGLLWWASLIYLTFGIAIGAFTAYGFVNRYLEHKALSAAGLPIVTTAGEIRRIAAILGTRLAVRRQRRAATSGPPPRP